MHATRNRVVDISHRCGFTGREKETMELAAKRARRRPRPVGASGRRYSKLSATALVCLLGALVAEWTSHLTTLPQAEAFVHSPPFGWTSTGMRHIRGSTCMMNERRGLWPQRPPIDLRSDTVTQPTGGMRKAMSKAEVGDDVLGEDPTIKRLEAETAELLGKEAALFVPSGTMANLICHLVWCSQRGSEMILGDQSHSFLWEQANAAQFGGIGYRPLPNLPDGTIDLQAIESAIRGKNPCFPVSRLLSIENTHAQCGGKVLSVEYLDTLAALAQDSGLRIHMDGARLWNAAAATRLPPSRIAAGADSVSVCFSKGLGAPVGSAVVGSAEFIGRAARVRKALGGGMRQSGVVAAAALEGLRKQLPRIGEDHANAKRLAQGLQDLGMPNAIDVDPSTVQTNIVMVTVGPDLTAEGVTASVVCDRLREKGVLAMAVLPGVIRFVAHSQVHAPDIQRAVGLVKEVLEEAGLQPLGVQRPIPPQKEEKATDALDVHSPSGSAAPETSDEQLDEPGYVNGDSTEGGGVSVERSDASATGTETSEAVSPALAVEAVGINGSAGATAGADVAVEGIEAGGEEQVEGASLEDEGELPPFREDYEEVELQGMTVSNEGFVAVMTSKESSRAIKLIVTPDDPMSGGLDVEQAETSEARTLLQLMQGIDVARHLPHDALGTLMDLSMGSGVKLSTVYVSNVKPFSATLTAKVPQRESESSNQPNANEATATSPGSELKGDDAWTDDGAAAAAAAATGLDPTSQAKIPKETPVSPSVPGTTMGVGSGRPRLGVSKIADTTSTFEALGLALRYPCTKIFVRAELLAATGVARGNSKGSDGEYTCSFDAADLAELYPNLMKLEDARARRSAADEIDAQFAVQKLRQQLESAVNAGDSDRISALRQELNSLSVADADTAALR